MYGESFHVSKEFSSILNDAVRFSENNVAQNIRRIKAERINCYKPIKLHDPKSGQTSVKWIPEASGMSSVNSSILSLLPGFDSHKVSFRNSKNTTPVKIKDSSSSKIHGTSFAEDPKLVIEKLIGSQKVIKDKLVKSLRVRIGHLRGNLLYNVLIKIRERLLYIFGKKDAGDVYNLIVGKQLAWDLGTTKIAISLCLKKDDKETRCCLKGGCEGQC